MANKRATRLEDYQALATIGTGSFGVCKKVRRKSDGKVSEIMVASLVLCV